jgi:SAM-dependent methyltransferase
MQRLVRAHRENPGVRFVCGRLSDLPFPEGFFDKILLSEVLEHLEDDLAGLREIHRILKPGGLLAISVPHRNYPLIWDPINKIREALGLEPLRRGPWVGIWTNHERLYDPQGLAERLERARFKVEIMEEATHYCFPFSHFIVYGIGKPLLEKGLLPEGIRQAADRFAAGGKKGGRLNPVRIGLAPFRWIDRLNDRPGVVKKRTFVNLLVKARKS